MLSDWWQGIFFIEIYEIENSYSGYYLLYVRFFTHLSLDHCADWKLRYIATNKDIVNKRFDIATSYYVRYFYHVQRWKLQIIAYGADAIQAICCDVWEEMWGQRVSLQNPTSSYFNFCYMQLYLFAQKWNALDIFNLLLHITLSVLTFFVLLFAWGISTCTVNNSLELCSLEGHCPWC